MTRERMIEVYGEKLNLLADRLEKCGHGGFNTFSDSADWFLEVYVSKHKLEGSGTYVLLATFTGGYSTGNSFTEDIVENNIYELVDLNDKDCALYDIIYNALKLTKCPVV